MMRNYFLSVVTVSILVLISLSNQTVFGQNKGSINNSQISSISLAPVRIGDTDTGKWGYINKSGKFVINPQFKEADSFNEGLASVRISKYTNILNNKCGFIDRKGNFIIDPIYNCAMSFSEGLALTEDNYESDFGFIDKNGKIVIKPIYKMFSGSFSEGLASVITDQNMGFIDKTGKFTIVLGDLPVGYTTFMSSFSEGLAMVRVKGENENDNTENDKIISFMNYMMNSKRGYIDKNGKVIIQPIYTSAYAFSEGLACVQISKDSKYGYINKQGDYEIEAQFDEAKSFSEGLAPISIGNRWGYIDKHGKIAINFLYDNANEFSDGLASVKISDKWGYINKSGSMVITPQFDEAGSFK